ncbi:MAG: BadF/BadG/BcrA/BcrD ATPase family protein [Dehalococcoidia bacterium]
MDDGTKGKEPNVTFNISMPSPKADTPQWAHNSEDGLMIGLDVGSTTVKAVVMNPKTDEILWRDYQRHDTRQAEKVLEFLKAIAAAFPLPQEKLRIFITGSGGGALDGYIGAKFVQEVNAVSLAVEKFYPDAGSVVELGGQDAKIIIWIEDPKTGKKRKLPSMNDKCAGGTGAVIDKINAKLKLSGDALKALQYYDVKLHPVAGKCGVFAETDINGLQKQGVQSQELMASLFEAIVQQNLSVLTRGNTLRPKVLLLGGPNTFIPALQDAWRNNIPPIWEERNTPLPEGVDPKELIIVPENAQYYAAIGSVLYGKSEDPDVGVYKGSQKLDEFIEFGRVKMREASGDKGLVSSKKELKAFLKEFEKKPFEPVKFSPGEVVEAYIGIDGGSTSTKAVLMNKEGKLLTKAYQLSKGNPLEDTKDILKEIDEEVKSQGATLVVKGVGTTGYAKDILRDALSADVALVETVAHTQSALHYYDDVDVIVDVGGQDIKVIVLKNGRVKDFKLNTQCSAGNGYFLQSTATRFGHDVTEYADLAFQAQRLPVFSYGCAVFMEADIVNFQQLGWDRKEIMAGLAKVLPKNIWLYVVAEPNLAKFGNNFVLQGGTQYNLAAVKSQYDFIKSKVPDARIIVHEHCGESGAIGAALEAIRVVSEGKTSFVQMEAAENLQYTTTRNESTRCFFCKNKCLRTFIDTILPAGEKTRFIVGNSCEKGSVETIEDMKKVKGKFDKIKEANPNFVEMGAKEAFRLLNPPRVEAPRAGKFLDAINEKLGLFESKILKRNGNGSSNANGDDGNGHNGKTNSLIRLVAGNRLKIVDEIEKLRANVRIGMPRVLNMYSSAPFFIAYLGAIGVDTTNIVFSEYTSEQLYKEGSRRGSIDACFPSKVCISHVHNLIFNQRKKPHIIFFPILHDLKSDLVGTTGSNSCPTVAISPEVVKAAFTKEGDVFAENGIRYVAPGLNMTDPALFEKQMYECWNELLGVTWEENKKAIEAGNKALDHFYNGILRKRAKEVLEQLEREDRVGVVMLGRPYHTDPGLNHDILVEIQKLGYPIFAIWSLPIDEESLNRLFGEEIANGEIEHGMSITDIWKNAYSENSSMKVWGAKYVARHPNLVAIDLSSFKCGHDAPIYSVVAETVEATGTPYFTFHDIDENKPSGSIKIRVETIDYFLKRYQEELGKKRQLEREVERQVQEYAEGLRRQKGSNGNGSEESKNSKAEQPEVGAGISV